MHVFRIEKVTFDDQTEIRGLQGNGTENFWNMQPVHVIAKPNSQVEVWSDPIWLVHTLPEKGDMPTPTCRHHLFKKMRSQGAPCIQSKEDLAMKLTALKKTVTECSKLKQWEKADTDWWETFWEERVDMPVEQNDKQDFPADSKMENRIKRLLYGDPEHIRVEIPTVAPVTVQEEETANAMRDLEMTIQPRTTRAGIEEFGRSRAIGYLLVDKNTPVQSAVDKARMVRDSRQTKELERILEELKTTRGKDELAFANNKIQVIAIPLQLFIQICVFDLFQNNVLIETNSRYTICEN